MFIRSTTSRVAAPFVGALLGSLWLGATAATPSAAAPGRDAPGRPARASGGGDGEAILIRALAVAVLFRHEAATDTNAAVAAHASDACREQWAGEVAPYFVGQDLQWPDFFSSSVIHAGGAGDGRAVVAFHNPWHDALLLTEWEAAPEGARMAKFLVITGESWRRESFPPEDALAAWERESTSPGLALGAAYGATRELFEQRYPLHEPSAFPPRALKKITRAQAEQLAVLKARMLRRFEMFSQFMRGANEMSTIRRVVADASRLIQEGRRAELARACGRLQDADMFEALFALPEVTRARLAPNYVIGADGRAVVALVNSRTPAEIVFLYLAPGDGGALTLMTIEVFALPQLEQLADMRREALEGRR